MIKFPSVVSDAENLIQIVANSILQFQRTFTGSNIILRYHFVVIVNVFIAYYGTESKILELFFLFQVERRYLVIGNSTRVSCR
jgi:hypothetical protein